MSLERRVRMLSSYSEARSQRCVYNLAKAVR